MKKFVKAELEEIMVSETAYGPLAPIDFDSEEYEVKNDDGEVIGYRRDLGTVENHNS